MKTLHLPLFLALVFIFLGSIYTAALGQQVKFHPYSNAAVEQGELYQNGNPYQKDALLFLAMLHDTHPAFALEEKPFEMEAMRQEAYKWAETCQTAEELHSYLQSIATRMNDSHTSLLPMTNSPLIYPFSIFWDAGKVYLRAIDTRHQACLGKEILSINGYPVSEIIKSFKPCISSENETYYLDKVNGFMQFFSTWHGHKYAANDSTLTLGLAGIKQPVVLSPTPINKNQLAWVKSTPSGPTIRKPSRMPFDVRLLKEESICYLQINTFTDQSSVRFQYITSGTPVPEQIKPKLAAIPRFDTFIRAMFDSIRVQQMQTLVIDLRGNKGGNSRLGEVLLSYLKPEKDLKRGKTLIRMSELWEKTYTALATEYRNNFKNSKEPLDRNKLYDPSLLTSTRQPHTDALSDSISRLFVKNQDAGKIFNGEVIIIQDEKTFSSAGMFVTQARDNGIGKIIGTNSAYAPTSYGDLLSWELPNTQIRGVVSHKIFLRPAYQANDTRYLSPDVLIPSKWNDILTGKDAPWEWVLKHSN